MQMAWWAVTPGTTWGPTWLQEALPAPQQVLVWVWLVLCPCMAPRLSPTGLAGSLGQVRPAAQHRPVAAMGARGSLASCSALARGHHGRGAHPRAQMPMCGGIWSDSGCL